MKRYAILLLIVSLSACYAMLPPAPPPEQFVTRIIWPWDSTITYSKGDMATMPQFLPGGPIYKSLQDENLGIQPPSFTAGTNQQTYYSTPTNGWENWWILSGTQQ